MNPHDIGKAYDQITHLQETEGYNRNNGIDQHKRAIAFVRIEVKRLMFIVALSAIYSGHSQDLQRLWLVPGIGCQ